MSPIFFLFFFIFKHKLWKNIFNTALILNRFKEFVSLASKRL